MRGVSFAIVLAIASAVCAVPRPETRDNFPTCTTEFPTPVTCNQTECGARENCACIGTQPGIPVAERPQIVYLTFDDGFTKLAMDQFYTALFSGDFKNPNGCNIRATHFLTHQSTDYSLVNKYHAMGHEMASHSITHRSNITYWSTLSEQGWKDEMVGMRTIIANFANIPEEDIKGIRVPYLQSGGDTQYAMMMHENFKYDCSRPTRAYGYTNMGNGIWPFTMDYQIKMDCQIAPCPKCSFPEFWVQPMLDLEDDWFDADGDAEFGNPCAMLDSCIIPESQDPLVVKAMLMRNFERSYNGNTRAPFGLYVHAAWFFGQEFRYQGYKLFLEEILKLDDVWIVPVDAGIEYRKNPMTNADLKAGNFEPFNCNGFPKGDCPSVSTCQWFVDNEDIHGQSIYMKHCAFDCPINYPWLGNPLGE